MAPTVDLALLQTRPRPDFASALEEALPLAETAAGDGADLLLLPEYCGGLASRDGAFVPPAAPEADHPVLARFQGFAARHKVAVMLGSIAVTGPGGKIFNRGYMIGTDGAILGHYDKIHLFDIDLSEGEAYRESAHVSPGNSAVVHRTDFGQFGHTICYDLRFPHLFRDLAHAGADVICCPAAFTRKTGEVHWHALNRARAIETTSFIVSPCAIGPVPGGGECFGHSLVVGPWGEVIADGGDLPGIVRAQIDLGKVAEARARIPSLTHDRAYTIGDAPGRRIA